MGKEFPCNASAFDPQRDRAVAGKGCHGCWGFGCAVDDFFLQRFGQTDSLSNRTAFRMGLVFSPNGIVDYWLLFVPIKVALILFGNESAWR